MCVPVAATNFQECEPCLSIVTTQAAAADVVACRNAPARCRVQRGESSPQSCDASALSADIQAGIVRVPTPLRCGLRLPVSRLNVEPDRLGLVLAEAYPCTSPPCAVNNIGTATYDAATSTLWQEVLALADLLEVDLGAPGFTAPSCFPFRTEVGSNTNPVDEGSPMGYLAQVEATQYGVRSVVNSPICGWVKPPPILEVPH